MTKKERVQRGQIDEEFVRLTMTGKVNAILDKKVPVKLEEIFQLDEEKRKVILIEGAPGSGKSTLSWDICQRWGAGKLFQEFETVVLVCVRDPEAQKASEIVGLLPAEDRSMAESVAAEIVACRGKKVLFVIDGWDEGGSSLLETSAIRRLIQSELCCESSVIVTSRFIASRDLQPLASSRIEIVGFTPAELRQYFSECLEGDCGAVDKLLESIQEHPEVEGSCYLPLNAAIIVHLFLSEGHTIPSTQYGIFSAVVLNCMLRHLKQRTEEGRQIRCLESCVCVTTRGEFRVDLRRCSIDDHKCRFLTRCLCRCPVPNSAATGWLHMNLQGNDIRERGAQHIADVLQNTSIVHTLLLGTGGLIGNTITECGLKCILESLLTNCSLDTVQLFGSSDIVLKITQESSPVLSQILQRNKTLTELDLSGNRGVSDTGAFFIAEGLKLNTSLRTLRLSGCGISAEGAKFISGALEVNAFLKIIDLGRNELGDTGVGYLANALKQNDSLKELYLEKCGMTDRGLELLAVALSVNKPLEVLYLRDSDSISVGGLSVLTEHLKKNIGLVKLHLPVQLKSGSRLLDTVNEARRRSGLLLIEVDCELQEYQLQHSITACSG